jgi:hypothetical protein
MLLTQEDFQKYARLSGNISLAELQNDIDDALKMDVSPLLGELHDRLMAETPDPALSEAEQQVVALIPPVWVMHAYKRFLQFHGITVAAAGITRHKDEKAAYEHVSMQERSQLLNVVGGKIAYYEGELGKALKEVNGKGRGGSKRSRIGLRVIRARG